MTKCPLCNGSKSKETSVIGVSECTKCGAVHGQCYLGDSYGLVKPFMVKGDVPFENTRYFDLTCVGSEGVTRRHGWFEPETRLIVQVG